jgi:cyclopropane-fatty-acyl-phospholipid synthase
LGRRHAWYRQRVLGRLNQLTAGGLELVDGTQRFVSGGGGGGSEPRVRVTVHRPQFYRAIVLGGTLGAADAYLRGDWDCDDLPRCLELMARELSSVATWDRGLGRGVGWLARAAHRLRPNSRAGSRRNISSHYDLGNEFFELFLDPTMTYSCGHFPTSNTSLEEASRAKYDFLCRELDLSPSDHLLEIGSGWGGLAVHAARRFGCRVTTTTLSTQQFNYTRELVARKGLGDQVTVLQRDYRDLRGQYDKLISIEMVEAVGHQYLPTYFQTCADRLRPGGLFAIQAITIPDARYEQYRKKADFIQKHIFPGGCLPSLGRMVNVSSLHGGWTWTRTIDRSADYAETLRRWRERLTAQLPEARSRGISTRLLRTWHYYFSYCEAAFRAEKIGLVQGLLRRPVDL